LAERLPAADDAGGVVHLELVVVVLQQILDAAADVGLFHGEDDDLVVHQQATLDGLGEGDDVEAACRRAPRRPSSTARRCPSRRGLGAVAIDARRGGHVEALGGADESRSSWTLTKLLSSSHRRWRRWCGGLRRRRSGRSRAGRARAARG
jgi:hypothetical protein